MTAVNQPGFTMYHVIPQFLARLFVNSQIRSAERCSMIGGARSGNRTLSSIVASAQWQASQHVVILNVAEHQSQTEAGGNLQELLFRNK